MRALMAALIVALLVARKMAGMLALMPETRQWTNSGRRGRKR